jgi:hypothetical protein
MEGDAMKHQEVTETWTGPGATDEIIVPLKPGENAAHPSSNRNYFEHWYFDAHLEDGHVVVGFVQAAELVTKKPGVELHVYKPTGEKLSITRPYSKSEVRASVDACDVWVGRNHAYSEYPAGTGLPVHRLEIAEGDMEADLTFHNELPGWKPGGGMTRYGDSAFFAWVVPAPRARVEGTVRVGDLTLDASGIGYHDHNWGVGDMRRIVSYWYWGRLYAGDLTLLYANVMTKKKYGHACSTPLMLARNGEIMLSTGEMTVKAGEPRFNETANRDYPSSLVIEVPGSLTLRLDVREVIDAHDFVDDLGPIFRTKAVKGLINRIVGRPGYFRFSSDFSLRAECGGETCERTGTTLHEMVALE